MQAKITYELTETDLRKVLATELADLQKSAVLGQFAGRLVGADTVAEIHDVHRDTVIKYAKTGLLEHQHTARLYKFQLSYILSINFHDLRKQSTLK